MATLAHKLENRETGEIYRYEFEKDVPQLAFVYLHSGGSSHDGKWRLSQLHTGQLMSVERLKLIIAAKENKANGYAPCDAYYLLIVVDFIDAAQDQEIMLDDFAKIESAVFEKILIYRTAFGHIVEAK